MEKDYRKYSDEDIIGCIRSGDELALDFLLRKYKPLVIGRARTLYLIGGDMDDLVQEGMIGLYKAVMDYDKDKISSFSYFARICIGSQLLNAIKASNRKKNIPLNTYISLYGYDEETDETYQLEQMLAQTNNNPEDTFIDKERTDALRYKLIEKLSKFETDVFNMYIEGINYTKIAVVLDRQPKAIDNAIQRIKSKFSLVIKELDRMEG